MLVYLVITNDRIPHVKLAIGMTPQTLRALQVSIEVSNLSLMGVNIALERPPSYPAVNMPWELLTSMSKDAVM